MESGIPHFLPVFLPEILLAFSRRNLREKSTGSSVNLCTLLLQMELVIMLGYFHGTRNKALSVYTKV